MILISLLTHSLHFCQLSFWSSNRLSFINIAALFQSYRKMFKVDTLYTKSVVEVCTLLFLSHMLLCQQ